jgi:hypothetical protein
MARLAWCSCALLAWCGNVSCGEDSAPVESVAAGHGGSPTGAAGSGGTLESEGGETGSWQHAEGGAENLAEQNMDSCVRSCSAITYTSSPTVMPCEPGTRMKRGMVYDDDEIPALPEPSRVPEDPYCVASCEQAIADDPRVCDEVIEWGYCTADAEFICSQNGTWYWNDCYELSDVCPE